MVSRRDLLAYLDDFGWRDVDARIGGARPAPAGSAARGLSGAAREPRRAPRTEAAPPRAREAREAPAGDPLAAADLAAMGSALAGCRRCRLCQGRTQVVFGVGNPRARVVFVGEGPGAEEDRRGEPFVGNAGQLLNAMLPSIGLRRQDVYIANIVKCRPPGNRDPQPDEAAACMPFLKRQIELIDPEVIVLLGRIAARYLLGTSAPISSYRGRWTTWQGRDVLPTYHPAYLLRSPLGKRDSWADFKKLKQRLDAAGAAKRG
ncbi:MAG TPA: uracil-DNA glycosylase [Thermoanaerobaculaceae bacterium]|nr:uracil-DNA glycosylase [Thermoanaerobaculaceae bacterium]